MNETIIKKKIMDLRVWSDNPRYGYGNGIMSEEIAINTLIDVVGEDKMFALAKDIVETGGLLGNTLPTIVEKDGKLLVYDGNRRISIIKALFNPSIVESISFRKRIESLVENTDLSNLETINVLLTDEENAFRIMDGTHTGERGGAGLIPWDAYNRDISLSSRGQSVLYPISFSISKLLGFKRKADFKLIQYTDFQRLFSSFAIKEEFNITSFDDSNRTNIKSAITALLAYKDYKKFKSFSREFNTTRDDVDSNLPISRFISWHKRILEETTLYSIIFNKVEIFEGEEVPDIKSNVKIIRRDDKTVVPVDYKLLEVSFENPFGKPSKTIDNRFVGDWKCKILYDGYSTVGIVSIKKLEEPIVYFNSSVVQEGSSFSLRKCVTSAISSKRKSMIDSMKIEYHGNNSPSIYNDVLKGDTKPGKYTFTFTFDNDGAPYSLNHEILVKPISDIASNVPHPSSPFVDILHIGTFVKLNEIAYIAKEINEVWLDGKYRLAVCGMRAVLELTLDDVFASRKISGTNSSDLKERLDLFVTTLLNPSNKILSNIANKEKISYKNEINFLISLDRDKLVKSLHLAAHKSATYVNIDTIFEMCRKDLSHIISLAELLLR